MVCAKCEKKLAKSSSSSLACSDVWRPAAGPSTSEAGRNATRKVGENKLLSSKARYSPYAPPTAVGGKGKGVAGVGGKETATMGKCETCRSTVARAGAKFCQGCAYKKGICSMCAKPILDVRGYKMSSK
ncbi:hypothetical protein JCM1841_004630 [Sporobolomyces salmonicolor]